MSAAHTPGPWSYRSKEHDDWGIVRAPTDLNGYSPVICQARDPYCLDGDELAIHRDSKTDPWEANARLIAAAPELISLLEAAVVIIASDYEPGGPQFHHVAPSDLLARARAAIAKALGRTPIEIGDPS